MDDTMTKQAYAVTADGASETRAPRVALFLPNLHGGGAERMMANLSEGFAERGVEVDLVLAAAEGPYLSEVSERVNVVDLGSSGVAASLPKLVRYLRRSRPEALLVTLNHASLVALVAKRLAGVPVRVFVRGSNMLFLRPPKTLKGKVMPALVKRLFPWADGHISVSQGVADNLHSFTGISEDKIYTIYNPVVTDALHRKAAQTPEHPWFGDDGPPTLLAAGRLTRQKDYPTLLRALARLREQEGYKETRLVILGEGEGREGLETLIRDLGLENAVDLPGFVNNPFSYMSRADLFVLSSAWEGLPGVLIQAMACGCPVVSTDCPSGPREILEGGRYGPLVPVGDEERLAEAMRKTLEGPLDSGLLKERAAAFSPERVVPQYLEVLLGGGL